MFKIKDLIGFFMPMLHIDSGGGGSSSPSQTTQTQELPEWAKPYAKNTLEKASALTEGQYQKYDQNRIAGFSPLQQQAQQGAANMQTNQLTGLGGNIAGAAGMGGLGYAMQQNPQNFQQNVGGYMNPYLEMSLAPQLREANRQYDIGATKQQGAATQAGAFGGSREAIMAAENERNRNMGLNDIIGRGYNTAFGNAQNQYNQSQQAQLQGLNTALQGAGQLGALGGQQFQQGMDINKLQSAYGGQEQALRQQGLDQAYQEFQNQQNYPYKQLGFMSDMIRGLPLGQQSTQQMYQAPGSLSGQLAGLGMGAYGLSKLSNFMAEGGLAESYADGGSVESPGNIQAIVSKLSDQQLQQAMEAAQARGDQAQMQIIQAEVAMRASERNGMAGAFNSLPQETQDGMTEMAGGGVVAFANGGDRGEPLPERATSPLGDAWRAIGGEGALTSAREFFYKKNERDRQITDAENLYPGITESMTPAERKRRIAAADRMMKGDQSGKPLSQAELAAKYQEFKASAPNPVPYDALTATRRSEYEQQPEAKNTKEVKNASGPNSIVGQAKAAAQAAGIPAETFEAQMKRLEKEFEGKSAEYKKEALDQQKKIADRLAENKSKAGYEALAQFGFNMAAQASKPGQARRQGIMGALESASAASPTLIQSLSESNKANRAAEDNLDKMRMDQMRFDQSLMRNDRQSAVQYANAISQDKKAQAMLDLERQKLGLMGQQYAAAATSGLGKVVSEMAQRDPEFAKLSGREQYKIASQIAGFSFRTDANNQTKFATALEKKIGENQRIKMLQVQMIGAKTPEEQAKIQRQIDEAQMQVRDSLIRTNPEFGEMSVGSSGAGVTIPKGVTIEKLGG